MTRSSGFLDRWNAFWYAQGNTLSLGIFRALFAVCLAREVPITRDMSLMALEGGFHLPYLPFIKPVSPLTYLMLHQVQYPFIALLGLGILPRLSAGTLLGLQGYVFFVDRLNFRNHPYFFLLVLLLLSLSPAGQSFSAIGLYRRLMSGTRVAARMVGTVAPLTIQRLLQFQISVVYFYAAIHKMTEHYLAGNVLARLMTRALLEGTVGTHLTGWLAPATLENVRTWVTRPESWVLAAWSTVGLELALAFALWIPRVRVLAMVAGIAFHLMIAWLMDIQTFSGAMIASYLLFLDPQTVPQLWQRMRGHSLKQPSTVRQAKRSASRRAGRSAD